MVEAGIAKVRRDFDQLAQFDTGAWTANSHYHKFLLRQVPAECEHALEVGCGTGAFSRRLAERAERVLAFDLSPQMIRVARSRSHLTRLRFEIADLMTRGPDATRYDCVASIAALHHLPQKEALLKLKTALKPGGTLIVMDLLESEPWSSARGLVDGLRHILAHAWSCGLRLLHYGRLRPPPEVRAAWKEHGVTDHYAENQRSQIAVC